MGAVPMAIADGPIDGKVYGKVNVSVVNTDTNSDDAWELNSNASRIGFKGATEISDSLEVFVFCCSHCCFAYLGSCANHSITI